MAQSATPSSALGDRPCILFDFDGTVADTTQGVLKTVRYVLRERGEDPDAVGDLTRFIGPPLTEAFQTVCGYSVEEARVATAEYRAAFDRLLTPADYPLFPGVRELLEQLAAAGKHLAVATSRLEERAVTMLRDLDVTVFGTVCGLKPPQRLTKVDAIRDALSALGFGTDRAVMVGDSHFDAEGAAAVGLPCIGVTWGSTARADELARAGACAVCSTPAEVAVLLGCGGNRRAPRTYLG